MTKIDYILPMKTKNIFFVIYPGFELLDLSGPVSVFSTANALQPKIAPYLIHTVSHEGGMVSSGAGVGVDSLAFNAIKVDQDATVLVVGADAQALFVASLNVQLKAWLTINTKNVARYGSICSGAFLLAAAGLLDHRVVTTHWAGCEQLQKMHPRVKVKPESLYVVDDHLWTSAGVTTGLDMSLEMLRRDQGIAIMNQVAKHLVVYVHRPGNQSQFSDLLSQQARANNDYSKLLAWVDTKLGQPIKVAEMASVMCMSERTFYRKFTESIGMSPSKYVEEAKLKRAKSLIEDGQPIALVAADVGFKSEAGFRTQFERRFGLTPSMHKQLHKVK
jgi:transcriptional regulator GlxA family with amidase domain